MSTKLVLRSKGNKSFCFTYLIWANEVREREMLFHTSVIFVVYVFMMICTKMTRVMLSTQMIEECNVVEEKLFAKITIRMRQYLSILIISNVALLNVCTKLVDVVESLLPNKHRSALEAYFAKCFLMSSFEMALQGSTIWKLLFGTWAIWN